MDAETYRSERLHGQRAWYSTRASRNKQLFLLVASLATVLAAFVPFAIAVDLPIVAAALGTLAAANSALLALFKWQDNWVNYRHASERLMQEDVLYATGTGPYRGLAPEETRNTLVLRTESIIAAEFGSWEGLTSRPAGSDASPGPSTPGAAPPEQGPAS